MPSMIDLTSIPLDDPDVYEMIAAGKNLGLFQIGEGWLRGMLRDCRPENFYELSVFLALIRPGALDNGYPSEYASRKRTGNTDPGIDPDIDDDLEPVLRRSMGMAVFQEDILEVIRVTTGWGYGEADILFNAFRKKDLKKLAAAKPEFFEASLYSKAATQAVWDIMGPFADYSFNRAHAVSYAFTTYWTAWLKYHYPAEFISSMLTHVDGKNAAIKLQKTIGLIKEAQGEGIPVLPPDVNVADATFTPTADGIRFGLAGIRDVGDGVVQRIIDLRPFDSAHDFVNRVDASALNAKALSALVRSGALDSLGVQRESLPELEGLAKLALDHRKLQTAGNRPLVPARYGLKGGVEPDWDQRAKDEKLYLGVQLTFPRIELHSKERLTDSEYRWVENVLRSRKPESCVTMFEGEYVEVTEMGIKSSPRGLQAALAKIGIEVKIR